jgi:hypothetical protein
LKKQEVKDTHSLLFTLQEQKTAWFLLSQCKYGG